MMLDTCFLIDIIEGDEAAIEKAKELETSRNAILVSSATVFELHTGVARCDRPDREKEKVMEVIESKRIVPADKRIMKKAGNIHGELVRKGNRIGSFDCIIGATAIVEEEALLTRNVEDFKRISDIDIKEY